LAYPYNTSSQLSDRLSVARFRRLLDDDADGTADSDVVTQILADASSKVAGYLQGAYDLAAVALNTPHEVVRLTLDVAVAMCAQRFPEVMPGCDWVDLMKAANADLAALRKNAVSLDTDTTPQPAANSGGYVFPDPNTEDVYSFARDGFGDL
jgi:phage gp36-like protein